MSIDLFQSDEIVSRTNVNNRLTQANRCFPVTLFSDSEGVASGDLLLSDNYTNYSVIGVYYFTENNQTAPSYSEFDTSITDQILLHATRINVAHTAAFIRGAVLTAATNKLTFTQNWSCQVTSSAVTFPQSYIYVYKVVGYKY